MLSLKIQAKKTLKPRFKKENWGGINFFQPKDFIYFFMVFHSPPSQLNLNSGTTLFPTLEKNEIGD